MNVTAVDKNFKVDLEIDKSGLNFYSVDEEPFRIYGIKRIDDRYYRMPPKVAETVSDGVSTLNEHTAGGRVRFVTDSKRVAIIANLCSVELHPHMCLTASSGFDIYADGVFAGGYRPAVSMPNSAYESIRDLGERRERLITINFPLYTGVKNLYIGLDKGAALLPAPDYKYEKPVVFYGSSITQGGCASRPGTCYQAHISHQLDTNYINLGFSGSAKAEREMAEYIAGLDMSAFVYDYDHNTPSFEHLTETHGRMFDTIRKSHPSLPIIIVTAPVAKSPIESFNETMSKRRQIIKATYDNAIASGDKNVYIIYGNEFFDDVGNEFSVDHCHPTDLGFYFMAKKMIPVISKALGKI